MLGKLLKHELRATGRIMLPIYGATVILAILANLSIRLLDHEVGNLIRIFAVLIITVFAIAIIAAAIMTLVLMVKRFYSNYLRDEGYLMHTLPVDVHGLVWSKMIVSCIWFAGTFIVIALILALTGLFLTGTSLNDVFAAFPSWKEIIAAMHKEGIGGGDVALFIAEMITGVLLAGLTTCLHFYAAMALGHMFSKDKILLSIVFFVAISFVMNIAVTGYSVARMGSFDHPLGSIEELRGLVNFVHGIIAEGLFIEAVKAALMYAATVIGLKRGLNLA